MVTRGILHLLLCPQQKQIAQTKYVQPSTTLNMRYPVVFFHLFGEVMIIDPVIIQKKFDSQCRGNSNNHQRSCINSEEILDP